MHHAARGGHYDTVIILLKYGANTEARDIVEVIFCVATLSLIYVRVRVMVFNATFNNISVISWRSVSLVEETRVPEKNHRPVMDYNVVSSIPRLNGIRIDIRKFRR